MLSVGGSTVGGEQTGDRGTARSTMENEDQHFLKPLTPPDSETTISQEADLAMLGIEVTIALLHRET